MDGKLTIIIIICVLLVLSAVITVSAKRKKSKQSANTSAAPMPEVSKETLNLVNDVYDEIKKERELKLSQPSPEAQPPYDDILFNDIDPELLNDLDPSLLNELTSSGYESGSPAKKEEKGTDEFSSLVSLTEDIGSVQPADKDNLPDGITAYLSGNYSLKGKSFSDGRITDTFVAMHDGDVRISSDFDSKKLDVLIVNGEVTLINPATNEYLNMPKKLMKLMGLKEDSFSLASYSAVTQLLDTTPEAYSATVDGENAVCYLFKSEEKSVKLFLSTDGRLLLAVNTDENGSIISALKADEFCAFGGERYMTTDGLKKSGLMAFFSELM